MERKRHRGGIYDDLAVVSLPRLAVASDQRHPASSLSRSRVNSRAACHRSALDIGAAQRECPQQTRFGRNRDRSIGAYLVALRPSCLEELDLKKRGCSAAAALQRALQTRD